MLPDRAEILIVGGGIIGLTLARELVARGRGDVLVLEKEEELGRHASGRNSGVLHAGIYYAPDSLKAKSCLGGNRLMKAFCEKNSIAVETCGKVIIATSQEEVPRLKTLHERGVANGVPGVTLIDVARLRELEPHANAVAARENAARMAGEPLADAGDPVGFILQDLESAAALTESSRLAHLLHERLVDRTGAQDNGVKQAPFYVLAGARMPAVLLELGFISHEVEGRRLKEQAYQERIVDAVADAVSAWRAADRHAMR